MVYSEIHIISEFQIVSIELIKRLLVFIVKISSTLIRNRLDSNQRWLPNRFTVYRFNRSATIPGFCR